MWDTHWTSKMAQWAKVLATTLTVGAESTDPQPKSRSLTSAGMLYVHGPARWHMGMEVRGRLLGAGISFRHVGPWDGAQVHRARWPVLLHLAI